MKQRYHLLDALRGATLVNMLAYHTAWDLAFIFGVDLPFMRAESGHLWQQAICWSFIFLSGFCWNFGGNPLRRGAICFGWGAVLTAVTLLLMPENRVLFGVLTLLGTCMMLMVPLDALLQKYCALGGATRKAVTAPIFFCASFLIFLYTRNINARVLGFGDWGQFSIPAWLYQGNFTAYLGFPQPGFYSTDYFSVLPWFFLFCAGCFAYHTARQFCAENGVFWRVLCYDCAPIAWVGRHSLTIYVLHQPVIFGALFLWFQVLAVR